MTALLCAGTPAGDHLGCSGPGAEAVYFGADQPRITAEMVIPWPALGFAPPAPGAPLRAEVALTSWHRERWMSLSGRAPEPALADPAGWRVMHLGDGGRHRHRAPAPALGARGGVGPGFRRECDRRKGLRNPSNTRARYTPARSGRPTGCGGPRQLLGRGAAGAGDRKQGVEVVRLVLAALIAAGAAVQPVAGDVEHFERDVAEGAAAERRVERRAGARRAASPRAPPLFQSVTRSQAASSAARRRAGRPTAPAARRAGSTGRRRRRAFRDMLFSRTSGKAWSDGRPSRRQRRSPGKAGSFPAMKSRNDWPPRRCSARRGRRNTSAHRARSRHSARSRSRPRTRRAAMPQRSGSVSVQTWLR